MGHFEEQNEPFGRSKWAVLEFKMSHFEDRKNVKKLQGLCF
jgi:hypothetical protein